MRLLSDLIIFCFLANEVPSISFPDDNSWPFTTAIESNRYPKGVDSIVVERLFRHDVPSLFVYKQEHRFAEHVSLLTSVSILTVPGTKRVGSAAGELTCTQTSRRIDLASTSSAPQLPCKGLSKILCQSSQARDLQVTAFFPRR